MWPEEALKLPESREESEDKEEEAYLHSSMGVRVCSVYLSR